MSDIPASFAMGVRVGELERKLAAAEAELVTLRESVVHLADAGSDMRRQRDECRELLETACDAWECGEEFNKVFHKAFLPVDWYTAAKEELDHE